MSENKSSMQPLITVTFIDCDACKGFNGPMMGRSDKLQGDFGWKDFVSKKVLHDLKLQNGPGNATSP